MAFIPHNEPTEVAQPSEEPLDLPTPFVATQRSAILGPLLLAVAAVGSNHLHSQLGQFHVQRIGVVGAVADQASRERIDEAGVEGRGDQTTLVRRS
jgi:hypothetical protein